MILPVTGLADVSLSVLVKTDPQNSGACVPEFKDLYQVQETWKFFFLTHIQLCANSLF